MKPLAFLSALLLLLCTLSSEVRAEPSTDPIHPFRRIGSNTLEGFSGLNILLHTGAVAATYGLIASEADYHVQHYFSSHKELNPYTVPAVYLGYAVPVVLGGSLYLGGLLSQNRKSLSSGSAALQAAFLAVAYSSLLKAFTGRPNPDPESQPDVRAASREFRFGFLRGGIHYGWPSGHLATNTATVVAALYVAPDNLAAQLAGIGYLAYLGFGVAAHEGSTMHWTSDIVAGTLMGFALGSSVGKGFRNILVAEKGATTSWTILPVVSTSYTGLSFQGQLY